MSVTNEREEYTKQLSEVTKNRDCVIGQRRVKNKTTIYLKPLASQVDKDGNLTTEGKKDYDQYLQLALFFNAVGRTVDGLTGLIFRKDPVIELPEKIKYLKNNVSASNLTMISQMQSTVRDAFITPRSGLLVDFPDVVGEVSRADAEELNLRPKILAFPYESITNWYFDTVNGEYQIVLLVLKEAATERIDKFTTERKTKYRVLELIGRDEKDDKGTVTKSEQLFYHHSLYDEGGDLISGPTIVMMNDKPATKIPFFLIETLDGVKAPIDDLVDVNLNHYNMFASYANKEHTSGFPIFWESGVEDESDDKNIAIGPGAKWTTRNAEAQFGVLETNGDGGSLRSYLEDRKTEMAALGAEMLNPLTGQSQSGESKRLDKVAQNATTADVANTVSRAYQQANEVAAAWMGANPEEVEVKLNTDYIPDDMNSQLLTALMVALQNGNISYDTFYENLQRGEIANPKRSAEDEKKLIANSELGLGEVN